jgi:STE24 endopeptidase
MGLYTIVILSALLLDWAVNLLADLLNIRALRPDLPEEFRDVYDAATYRRSQEYTRAQMRFGQLSASAHLVALLGFWYADGFASLDRAVAARDLGPIWSGLAFIGALVLAQTLLGLPFRLYSTFVLESRFGFNRTTPATFWADAAKALALGLALGGPLLAAILAFFTHAGPLAWLYCWIATALVMLAVQFIAPTWLLPLFNRFTPITDGRLHDAILAYARSVSFPLRGIFVIDGSRRTSKSNAFFTGFGRHKRIALFDTLVDSQSIDEVVAVVAHEIGHYKKGHVPKRLLFALAHSGVLFFLLSRFLSDPDLFHAFGIAEPSVHAGLVFFGLLYTPIELALSFVLQADSRRDELTADRFAVETTGRPESLAAALKRLASGHLANLTPHPLYVALNYSHPPMLERLAALRAGS